MTFSIDTENMLTRQAAETRSTLVSNTSYTLELTLKEHAAEYKGRCRVAFDYHRGGTDHLKLDFITRQIHSVTLNGRATEEYLKGDFAIYLNEDHLTEGRNTLEITYTSLFDNTGSGFHKFHDPEDNEEYMHTDFEPYDAHCLFPCFDQPDIKASYQLTVNGPSKWTYIHNTLPEHTQTNDDEVTIAFKRTPLFSTYLFALVVGPYTRWEERYKQIPLGIYCRKSLAKYMDQDNIFAITREAMATLVDYFDYPYPYDKYDQVFVPEFNFGAMENVGCVTFSEHYIFRNKKLYSEHLNRANTITHEMVHMWFGDLVTMKWWNDLWLNESFADYLSYFAMSKGKLFSDALEHMYARKEWAYQQDQYATTHPIAASARDTIEAFSNFDGISYSKGASVLRQLQYYIGDEAFRASIGHYFKRFAEQNTTLDDFLSIMSENSGIDIVAWSHQWLETTGVNTLLSRIKNGRLMIEQQGSANNNLIRQHAIEFTGYRQSNGALVENETKKIIINGKTAEAPLKLDTAFVILNTHDHDYVKVFYSNDAIAIARRSLHTIEDPFARRLVWGSLWQMVRDNALAPTEFIRMGIELGLKEKDLSILNSHIIAKIKAIVSVYLTDDNRAIWMPRLNTMARERLAETENSEEQQIIWFGLLLETALLSDELDYLHALVTGAESIASLVIDQEKRWNIIARLMAYGHAEAETLFSNEKELDKSDLGLKKAFMVQASRPDSAEKETCWQAFTEPSSRSTDFLRYGMNGFHWRTQKDILAPYVDRYFEAVEKVYTERDVHYTEAFGQLLFPHWDQTRKMLHTIEAFLDEKDKKGDEPPALLRKKLIEQADDLKRILPILEKQQTEVRLKE
ncbi:aminopeptidase N [Prosthecochloris aestuarii DSM 271]|uniref:Aminopeptidase N n=1 Tax=Prosthecochloris aestuarii (strain DSM 271 / SK 413) TaxID=290512 RepID=B4S652_PROA2|nr:aminopeptidase N [Prosthecochloris aestuarii]ACF45703.1 aminopeptidase N [Prosthecochloris aestuarii DSM 271]